MKIAIIIPCYNEAVTIAKVIRDFRASIPEADIHVFDNLSADGTGDIARAAGAIVHLVPVQGKGAVVRQMFRDIECDIGVMVDGDDTYPADKVRLLIQPVIEGRAEMVVGTRLQKHEDASFRPLHVFGNQLVLRSINTLFGATLSDVLSGYRAFSTRFMSTTPVLSKGFEIETEITLHALEHHMPIVEVPVPYGVRPDGSESKLHTFRDGYRVLKAILWLYKDYRPLFFFGML
ncbi:MAG: glycosyltransferase, partial [Burkholderiales bacterium]